MARSGVEDPLGDDEIFRLRPRRNTLENLPEELLARVDGGKLSKQGRIDRLLAKKSPAEVRGQAVCVRAVCVHVACCACVYEEGGGARGRGQHSDTPPSNFAASDVCATVSSACLLSLCEFSMCVCMYACRRASGLDATLGPR